MLKASKKYPHLSRAELSAVYLRLRHVVYTKLPATTRIIKCLTQLAVDAAKQKTCLGIRGSYMSFLHEYPQRKLASRIYPQSVRYVGKIPFYTKTRYSTYETLPNTVNKVKSITAFLPNLVHHIDSELMNHVITYCRENNVQMFPIFDGCIIEEHNAHHFSYIYKQMFARQTNLRALLGKRIFMKHGGYLTDAYISKLLKTHNLEGHSNK